VTLRILHFADAHIDMANYGRFDPESMLPIRVTDFLKSLDRIIDTALDREVDLVIFAGDAYKDRNPHPTFQREWGRRIMRLSQAGIPTVMVVGNHDVSPAAGRAHAIAEFDTLRVPHVIVADQIRRYDPDELGLELQLITVPWIPRSQLMTRAEMASKSLEEIRLYVEDRLIARVNHLLEGANSSLPIVLAAHATISGAEYGSEQLVRLGNELVLTQALVRDSRLDYVALGHIHKHQNLNLTNDPPVIYPGSIERVDFGEAAEDKGFVLAEVARGEAHWQFIPLQTRPFRDIQIRLDNPDTVMEDILRRLPRPERLEGAIVRLRLSYPAEWEALIDDAAIRQALEPALEGQITKFRLREDRSRLGDAAAVETLTPTELLDRYWKAIDMDENRAMQLHALGTEIIRTVDENSHDSDPT
jgi:DNA repair protein SbcD/Mre11